MALLLAAGCVAPFSSDVRAKVDGELNFPALFSNPEIYADKVVILGGEVISTDPLENHTEVIMLEKPLGVDWRPKQTNARGRFILVVNTFLDPAVWKNGSDVTAIARVAGHRDGKIGRSPYSYPVVEAIEWRLWAQLPPPVHYYHYDPFWDPYCRGRRPPGSRKSIRK